MSKFVIFAIFMCCLFSSCNGSTERWSIDQAKDWQSKQSWLVGSNYVPFNAINQLEMWQEDTFDLERIDTELGWAEEIGMNTMRVFLHDLLWEQDASGFKKRMDSLLNVASKHGIKPLFVLFDSCWDPAPKLGLQHPPIPGVHNSGWVQGPGSQTLNNPSDYSRLEQYVKDIMGTFRLDDRILGWDVWNEPDNAGGGDYVDDVAKKQVNVAQLLPQVFAWARNANVSQPLTSGIWLGDNWADYEHLNSIQKTQLSQSDFISFHDYSWPEVFEARVKSLQVYNRPLLCTEYMARGAGSTFDTILPLGKSLGVGMINWGFVVGKSQTNLPWDSWDRPYTLKPPTVWFHDLFYSNGVPYRAREVEIFKSLTGVANK